MKLEMVDITENKYKCKRSSRLKKYFDDLVIRFLEHLKEQVSISDDEQLIDALNEILLKKQLAITLDEDETAEFRKYSSRDYSNGDTCTYLENGIFTTAYNGPKQFIKALLDIGVKPPIKARIKFNRQGNIVITFTRKL